MWYRHDDDLEFLNRVKSEDLNELVYCLTHDEEGKHRGFEELTKGKRYKKYYPDHHQYWQDIAGELQRVGANSFMTFFRLGKGIRYKTILEETCDKLDIKCNKNLAIEDKESEFLMKFVSSGLEKMSQEELNRLTVSLGLEITDGITANVLKGIFKTFFFAKDLESYQKTLEVVNAVKKILLNHVDCDSEKITVPVASTALFGLGLYANSQIESISNKLKLTKSNSLKLKKFGLYVLAFEVLGGIGASAVAAARPSYNITKFAILQIATLRRKTIIEDRVDEKKVNVEDEYCKMIELIKKATNELDASGTLNHQSKLFKSMLLDSLKIKIGEVERFVEKSRTEMRWDRLVISLFGETNAGKSTIIETFRILFDSNRQQFCDGCIVGDGRTDFTKEYHEYDLSIDGQPLVLIDMPGIEGDESEFKDCIKKALRQSHCVFYVHGHDKSLETPTIEKIRSYLRDGAQVYSVYNVRGGVRNYDNPENRRTLYNDNIIRVENEIKRVFQQTLGNVYEGNITLQALLAMCAIADFDSNRQNLQKTQQMLLDYFGSSENILQYSQFQTLTDLVEQKAKNYKFEILKSNMNKIGSLKKKIKKDLNSIVRDANIELYMSQLNKFKSELEKSTKDVCSWLKTKTFSLIRREYESLMLSVNNVLASKEKDKEEQIKGFNATLEYNIEIGIQSLLRESIERWNDSLLKMISIFDGFDNQALRFVQSQGLNGMRIDFTQALEQLRMNSNDMRKLAASVGGGALIGLIGSPIGAVVGAAMSGIGCLIRKYSLSVGNAQEAAKNVFENKKGEIDQQMRFLVENMQKKFYERQREICQEIDEEFQSVEKIRLSIANLEVLFNMPRLS